MKAELFNDLVKSLGQASEYLDGKVPPETRVRTLKIHRSTVAEIRLKTNLTQSAFAKLLGTSIGTVTKWERGERQPSGAAATLLRVIEFDPTVIHKAFGLAQALPKRKPRSTLAAAE